MKRRLKSGVSGLIIEKGLQEEIQVHSSMMFMKLGPYNVYVLNCPQSLNNSS